MKLIELLNVLDEDVDLWVNESGEYADHYDGKNSINEEFNSHKVVYVTRNGFGGIVIEIE